MLNINELFASYGSSSNVELASIGEICAELDAPAVVNTASGLPINVEGYFCKMLTVQAVPTAPC
jgi:seryl-tRNA(Sec) selenium transferase